jgi:hypothetical protein
LGSNGLKDRLVAPGRKTAGPVIASLAALRLHPQIGGLVEKELLEKMGGSRRPVAGAS